MIVSYRDFHCFEGWELFPAFIQSVITSYSCRRVAEIGAGANPAISQSLADELQLKYVTIDADPDELAKAEPGNHIAFDLCGSVGALPGAPYDLIFSRMTAEHFANADVAYGNIFRSLVPGGLSINSFSTLYALPFVVNRLLPHSASNWLLQVIDPREYRGYDKFDAYYSHCRGPIRSQVEFLNRVGFEILEYRTYFGHQYYKRRFRLLDMLENKKIQLLLRAPVPYLTSYATVIMRRPTGATQRP